MAISRPVNAGYNVILGSATGTHPENGMPWIEWKVLSQNINKNTSTVRIHLYMSRGSSNSGTYGGYGGEGWIMGGDEVKVANSIPYDFRDGKITHFGYRDVTHTHNNVGVGWLYVGARILLKGGSGGYLTGGNVTYRSVQLPTIPRAGKIGNIGRFVVDDGERQGVPIYLPVTRYNMDFRYELTIYEKTSGAQLVRINNHIWNEIVFYGSWLDEIYRLSPANEYPVTIEVKTYNGDTLIGTDSTTATLAIGEKDRVPFVSDNPISVSDSYPYSHRILGEDTHTFIHRVSTLDIALTYRGIARKGASIEGKGITLFAGGQSIGISQEEVPYHYEVLDAHKQDISVTYTDNRGNASSHIKRCNFIDYTPPVIEARISRTVDGQMATITGSATYHMFDGTPGQNKMDHASYRYKERYKGTWSELMPLPFTDNFDGTVSIDHTLKERFDIMQEYDFEVYVADYLIRTVGTSLRLPKHSVSIDIDTNSRRVAVGGMIHSALPPQTIQTYNGVICVRDNISSSSMINALAPQDESKTVGMFDISFGKYDVLMSADIVAWSYYKHIKATVGGYTRVSGKTWHMPTCMMRAAEGSESDDIRLHFASHRQTNSKHILVGDNGTNWRGIPMLAITSLVNVFQHPCSPTIEFGNHFNMDDYSIHKTFSPKY